MTLERLWAGWRGEYVASIKPLDETEATRSVFARILASGLGDDETYVVHRGTTCFVILNTFPYGSGHLLVMPFREVGELGELTPEESAELWALTTDAVAAVQAAYGPDGVNARTSGVYLRADAEDLAILDGNDDRRRAELIAERLARWKSIANA